MAELEFRRVKESELEQKLENDKLELEKENEIIKSSQDLTNEIAEKLAEQEEINLVLYQEYESLRINYNGLVENAKILKVEYAEWVEFYQAFIQNLGSELGEGLTGTEITSKAAALETSVGLIGKVKDLKEQVNLLEGQLANKNNSGKIDGLIRTIERYEKEKKV
jgi:hypothetical protein